MAKPQKRWVLKLPWTGNDFRTLLFVFEKTIAIKPDFQMSTLTNFYGAAGGAGDMSVQDIYAGKVFRLKVLVKRTGIDAEGLKVLEEAKANNPKALAQLLQGLPAVKAEFESYLLKKMVKSRPQSEPDHP